MVPTGLIVAVKQKTNFVSTVYTLVSWRLSFFVLFPLSLSALWAEQLSTLQIILFKSLGVWFNCFIRPMGTIKRINWVQITKQVGRWIWKICVVIALSFKCLLFNIGTLKFTVVPKKPFGTWKFGQFFHIVETFYACLLQTKRVFISFLCIMANFSYLVQCPFTME